MQETLFFKTSMGELLAASVEFKNMNEWMNIYFTNVHLKIIDNIINEVKLKLNEISYEHIMIIIIDES